MFKNISILDDNKRTKAIIAGSIAGCLCLSCFAGSLAYFTAKDEVVNPLTVDEGLEGKLGIEELNWCPEQATNMVPLQTVAKDPHLTNEGDIPAYMFADVKVPATTAQTVQADGSLNEDEGVFKPLFTLGVGDLSGNCGVAGHEHKLYQGNTWIPYNYTVGSKWNDSWVLSSVAEPTNENPFYVYRIKYNEVVSPGENTPDMFKAVQFNNFIESKDLAKAYQILVTGYCIQSEGFDNVDNAMTAYFGQNQ